ncbi:hypothetical protein P171DRAFT_168841 [Karstenula rhodostoma CBS 690.94]|uniref:Uncharacterized protein n=1 Tax=Karstenula rhodostoma CBS 690.94 TaxID=1392251 RepID=A0A9P4U6M8_9PLEO|nr:hypothetical protein P171DRAFT_168841 [Karstenula rhodostoma CBS 690.94]
MSMSCYSSSRSSHHLRALTRGHLLFHEQGERKLHLECERQEREAGTTRVQPPLYISSFQVSALLVTNPSFVTSGYSVNTHTMTPATSSGDALLTLQDVERLRQDTAKLSRKLKLQDKICKSHRRGNSRDYEAKLKLQVQFEDQMQQYARLSCQQLCHEAMNTFPREIRDMVYSAMLDRGHAFKNVIQLSGAAHERHLRPLSTNSSAFPPLVCRLGMGEKKNEHCWDVKFCGEPFVKELVEMYYREKTFEFRQQELYLLPTFLGQGLSPPKTPNEDTVVPIQQVGRLTLCIRPTGNGWRFTLKTLQSLLELQRKAKIKVIMDTSLVIVHGEVDIEQVITTYRSLFPFFASLRGRGHAVGFRFGVVKVLLQGLDYPTRSNTEWADIAQKRLDAAFAATKPSTQS